MLCRSHKNRKVEGDNCVDKIGSTACPLLIKPGLVGSHVFQPQDRLGLCYNLQLSAYAEKLMPRL